MVSQFVVTAFFGELSFAQLARAWLKTLIKWYGSMLIHLVRPTLQSKSWELISYLGVQGRQCADLILLNRRLLEKTRIWNVKLMIVKLDVHKAFDKLLHGAVLDGLLATGLDYNYVLAFMREIVGGINQRLHLRSYVSTYSSSAGTAAGTKRVDGPLHPSLELRARVSFEILETERDGL